MQEVWAAVEEVLGPLFSAPGELETRRADRRLAPASARIGLSREPEEARREGAGSEAVPPAPVPCRPGRHSLNEGIWVGGITP